MGIASRVGIETAIVIAAVAPLIALGMWSSRSRAWLPLFAFVALFALDDPVLLLPRMGPFAALRWNWQGKLLEVAWVVALAAMVCGLSLRDIGATTPLRPDWRVPVLVVGAVMFALPMAFIVALGARDQLTVEGWCFQATAPRAGLHDERVHIDGHLGSSDLDAVEDRQTGHLHVDVPGFGVRRHEGYLGVAREQHARAGAEVPWTLADRV